MTSTSAIKLANTASESAWKEAGLGAFDADSSLADEIDTDGDGNITASEIEAYSAKTSKDSTESTPDNNAGADSPSYSVVDIAEAPGSYDEMKTVMNECITSFDGMMTTTGTLSQENENIMAQIQSLTAQVAAISTFDNTGSGKNSAYSLSLAGEENSDETTNTTSSEATEADVSNAASKSDQADALATRAVTNLGKLTRLSDDRNTTATSAGKILEKTGGKSKTLRNVAICVGLSAAAGATAALTTTTTTVITGIAATAGSGIATTAIAPILTTLTAIGPVGWAAIGVAAIGVGLVALFGGHKSKEEKLKEEINKLGETADAKNQNVQAAVEGMKNGVMATEDSAKILAQIAQTKETTIKDKATAAGNWDNSMLTLTTSTTTQDEEEAKKKNVAA